MQTYVRLFEISSQKKSFLATPNVENECWTWDETLESTGENETDNEICLYLHRFSELWNLFSLFPWEIVFGVTSGNITDVFSFKKSKNDCKVLKIILVEIFVHWNLKLLDFLSDFVLISFVNDIPPREPPLQASSRPTSRIRKWTIAFTWRICGTKRKQLSITFSTWQKNSIAAINSGQISF